MVAVDSAGLVGAFGSLSVAQMSSAERTGIFYNNWSGRVGEIIGEILKHFMKGWRVSPCKGSSNPWKFRMPHDGPPATKGMEIRDVVLAAFRVRV